MPKYHVIIPAAGFGSRMQSETPKQYLRLLGRPIVEHTLNLFDASPRIDTIHLVLSAVDDLWPAMNINLGDKVHLHRCGGESRAETVLNAVRAIEPAVDANDWVLVHDAARPGLTQQSLERLLDELAEDEVGGLLAIPLSDTLKRAGMDQRISITEPRESLWQAQTPQMFRYELLRKALEYTTARLDEYTPTDEAQAIEALGLSPKLVPGELRNLKITYPEDLTLAEAILRADKYCS